MMQKAIKIAGLTLLVAIFSTACTRTNEVEVTSNIIAASTGENLFSGRDELRVDWSRPANEAIEQINRRIVRRFPYVKK